MQVIFGIRRVLAVMFVLAAWGPTVAQAATHAAKVLLVVAHPDDEYAFAATTYRIARELGGTVDEVVITNGEGGYRYSLLAEKIYGLQLTREDVGRSHLPAIRKQETLRAGRILGIRHHYFLNQKDVRYTTDPEEALGAWDRRAVASYLDHLLERERYEFVFVLLPSADTHGHHQAASLLALEAVGRLPELERPAVLGAVAARHGDEGVRFSGRDGYPVTRTASEDPGFVFDRRSSFGFHEALNYSIVVNWVIAEHKSQGLFQTDSGRHDEERFLVFAVSRGQAAAAGKLFEEISRYRDLSARR